jgi:electron transport complex protein RnfC
VGDAVKAGQKLALADDAPGYAVPGISGTISDISPFTGDMGQTFTAVTIDADGDVTRDEAFAATGELNLETAAAWLTSLPGAPDLHRLLGADHGIHTLAVLGADTDLLVGTRQQILTAHADRLGSGIKALKEITGIDKVVLVASGDRFQGYGHIGADVKTVSTSYPSALPRMIMKDVFGTTVPAGKTETDMGVLFLSAEAVANIGSAYESKTLPTRKYVTVIGKDGGRTLVEAELGTPIRELLSACGHSLNEKDRLILGGPMTGTAIYTDLYPVCPDTDAIMVQDNADISFVEDTACINCGECVHACPVNIPVNLLVRYLAAGAYDDAADLCDLHACIECGLCTYFCVARIPISQYIRLGKHELDRAKAAEEAND